MSECSYPAKNGQKTDKVPVTVSVHTKGSKKLGYFLERLGENPGVNTVYACVMRHAMWSCYETLTGCG